MYNNINFLVGPKVSRNKIEINKWRGDTCRIRNGPRLNRSRHQVRIKNNKKKEKPKESST